MRQPQQPSFNRVEDDLEQLNFRYGKQDLLDDSEVPAEIREQRRQAIIKRRVMQAAILFFSIYILYIMFFRSEAVN